MKIKYILSLIIFLFTSIYFYAQKLQKDKTYVFDKGTVITVYDLKNDQIIAGSQKIAQSGWKFKIDQKYIGGYILQFLEWDSSDKEENVRKNNQFFNTLSSSQVTDEKGQMKTITVKTPIYFFIDDISFEGNVVEVEDETPMISFVTGAVTVPIKIRFGSDEKDSEGNKIRQFDFSNDINVGLSAGGKIRLDGSKQRAFFNLIGGISLTSTAIDEDSTNNFVDTKTNASAITFSLGFIFEYDDFQIGIITGWDRLSRELGENWVYQGKNWVGLGLGYSIFSTKNRSETNN